MYSLNLAWILNASLVVILLLLKKSKVSLAEFSLQELLELGLIVLAIALVWLNSIFEIGIFYDDDTPRFKPVLFLLKLETGMGQLLIVSL